MDSEKIRSAWLNTITVIGALLLLTGVLYRQTVIYLADIWSDISVGEYAHGFLVLAISLYLINHNRARLAKIPPCPSYLALLLLIPAVILWLAAVLVDVEMVQAAALLLIVIAMVWAVSGNQVIKVLAFPLLFIGFAIPVWFPLSPLLQNFTADVVFWVTRTAGIPAFRHDNLITVPGGTFSIEEACSGLRYLLAALTLGTLYAYLNYITMFARVVVVAVVAGAAILANILRVYIVVYLGYVTEMQHPWVDDHLMLGWYLFGGLMALLLFIDVRLYKPVPRETEADTGDKNVVCPCPTGRTSLLLVSVLCATVLIAASVLVYQQKNQQAPVVTNVGFDLPAEDWSVITRQTNDWMPGFNGAISHKTDYRVRGEEVSVFIAYYPVQKQGEEVINDLNRITNHRRWATQLAHPRTRHLPGHNILEQVIKNSDNKKRLLWYWYNIGGKKTVNKYEAKLLQLLGFLSGKPQAYMVAVSVAVEDDADADVAREALSQVIVDMEVPLANLRLSN